MVNLNKKDLKRYLYVGIAAIISMAIWIWAFSKSSEVPNPTSNSPWALFITYLHVMYPWLVAILGITITFISITMILYPKERGAVRKWFKCIFVKLGF